MGQRLVSTMSWRMLGDFFGSDRGGFGKEVLDGGIQGEDVETFPKDPFEMVKAR